MGKDAKIRLLIIEYLQELKKEEDFMHDTPVLLLRRSKDRN